MVFNEVNSVVTALEFRIFKNVNQEVNISFNATNTEFFEGRLGTPYQGFPEELQKIILKGANQSQFVQVQYCLQQTLNMFAMN